MIELCCIVERRSLADDIGEDLRDRAGDACVPEGFHLISCGDLACVAADVPASEHDDDPAALVERDRLIRRLMAGSPVIPFRLGTVVAGERQVRCFLEMQSAELRRLLSSLRGMVELALRAQVTVEELRTGCEGSGASYLRMRGRTSPAAGLDRLHAVLAAAAAAAVVSPDGPSGIKSAYLVGAGEVGSFCRLLAETTPGLPGIRNVSLTGPWPPYSFVGSASLTEPARHGREAVANG